MATQKKSTRTIKVSKNQEREVCEVSVGDWVCSPPLQVQETLAQARLAGKVAMREAEKAQAQLENLSNALLIYETSDNEPIRAAALRVAKMSSIEELRAAEAAATSQAGSASASAESIELRNRINEDMNNAVATFMRFYLPTCGRIGITPTRALRLAVKSARVNPEVLLGYEPVRVDFVAYAREDTSERQPRGNWLEASIPVSKLPQKTFTLTIDRSNVNGTGAKLCDKKWVGRKYRLSLAYAGNKENLLFADRSNKQIANDWIVKEVAVWADKQWSNGYGQIVSDMIGKGLSDVAEGMLHKSVALPQLLEKISGNTRPIVQDTAKPANADAKSALGKEANA